MKVSFELGMKMMHTVNQGLINREMLEWNFCGEAEVEIGNSEWKTFINNTIGRCNNDCENCGVHWSLYQYDMGFED